MSITTNISSQFNINAFRLFNNVVNQTTERLSSGMRINNAADDPMGLSLASTTTARIGGTEEALMNVQDGLSMVNSMDGALNEITNALMRMRDVAVRAANEAIWREDCQDRTRMQKEVTSLGKEITRMAISTRFAGKPILLGDIPLSFSTSNTVQATPFSTSSFSGARPDFLDNNTLVMAAPIVSDGTRPFSAAGSTQPRIIKVDLTNPLSPVQTWASSDPQILFDGDGDGFYEDAAGALNNDPQPGDSVYPSKTPATTNGWPDAIIDSALYAAEIPGIPGTVFSAAAFDIQFAVPAPANNNDRVYDVGGGVAVNVDRAIVDIAPAALFKLQYENATGNWADIGTYSGTGAGQVIDFTQVNTQKLRVSTTWDTAIGSVVNAPIQAFDKIASVASYEIDPTPIITNAKMFSAGGSVNIDQAIVNVANTKNYTIEYNNGGGWASVDGVTHIGIGANDTIDFGEVTAQQLRVVMDWGEDASAVTLAAKDKAALTLGAAAYINTPDNAREVAFTAGSSTFNQISVNVNATTPYQIETSSDGGATWAALGAARVGVGAEVVNVASTTADSVRVVLTDRTAAAGNASIASVDDVVTTPVLLNAPVSALNVADISFNTPPENFDQVTLTFNTAGLLFDLNDDLGAPLPGGVGLTTAATNTISFGVPQNTSGLQVVFANPLVDAATELAGATAQLTTTTNVALNAPTTASGDVPAGNAAEFAITGAPLAYDRVTVTMAAGPTHTYDVEDSTDGGTTWNAVGSYTSTGTGSAEIHDLGAPRPAADMIRVVLTDGTGASGIVSSVAASNSTARLTPDSAMSYTPTVSNNAARYDLTGGAQNIDRISVTVANGKNYKLQYDNAGVWTDIPAASDTGNAGNQDFVFGVINTAKIRVTLTDPIAVPPGVDASTVVSNVEIQTKQAVAAGADSYTPWNNVADFDLGAMDKIDEALMTVQNGTTFTVSYFSGAAVAGTFAAGVAGTGVANQAVDKTGLEVTTDKLRVTFNAGYVESTASDLVRMPTVVNRIDRDQDGWPDVIENSNELGAFSDEDDPLSVPFGAIAAPTLGPDNDGDGYINSQTYYDAYDDPGVYFAIGSSGPLGWTPTAGTGNLLTAPVAGADLPDDTDTDSDTIPDAIDPFPGVMEFETWTDEQPTSKGSYTAFVSNRFAPNTGAQEIVLYSSGQYTRMSTPGVVASAPQLSQDGGNLAWVEENGATKDIWAAFGLTDCSGTAAITRKIVSDGDSPTWSPDNTMVAFVRGGQLYYTEVASGDEYVVGYGIQGTNPEWSGNGDYIMYTGADNNIWAYSIPFEKQFQVTTSGNADQATWSPDGSQVAYVENGYVMTSELTINYNPEYIQAGSENGQDISLSFVDARSSIIGVSNINVLTVATAQQGITDIDNAIKMINTYRADIGTTSKRMEHILNDLNTQRIGLFDFRSGIRDADMAKEFTEYTRNQILAESAGATLIRANQNPASALSLLSSHFG